MKTAIFRTHLPTTLWGGVCIVLALVVGGLELDWGRQFYAPLPVLRKSAVKPAENPLLPEFALPPLEQGYPETVKRPLFVVTRLPAPPPPPPAPPKPAMQKGQFILLGSIITQDVSIALLKEKSSGKTYRVAKGKEINGITLEKVEAQKVTLTQGDDREELLLKINAAPRTVPAQTTAPPVQPPAGQPQQPGQPAAANGAPAPAAQNVPPATAGNKGPNDMVNRRRALRGLPPT